MISTPKTPPAQQGSKQWWTTLATFLPIWVVVLLAGWIVVATLLPIAGPDVTEMAGEREILPALDMMPASGPEETAPGP
jgi:hypothetical protein